MWSGQKKSEPSEDDQDQWTRVTCMTLNQLYNFLVWISKKRCK